MGFKRRAAMAGKVEVPDAAKEEVGLSFYYDIVQKVTGSNKKKAITLTFVIALNGAFLLIQAIYESKTTRCLPRVKFPESFCLSFNENHWDNKKESLKMTEDIIVPYVTKEREKLSSPNQPALLITDVFKGQMNTPILKKLEEHNSLITRVPRNMTNLFQPLDLTVNCYSKQFLKRKFVE